MDTTSHDPAAHECDHCGAPLPAADETGTRQCSFCKTVFRAPTPAAPVAPPQAIVFQTATQPLAGDFEPINRSSSRRGCGLGSLIVLAIVAAAIGIPIYALSNGGFDSLIPRPALRFVEAQPLLLPGEPSGPLAFVTMTSRYDQATSTSIFSLVKSDGVASTPVWSTDLTGQGYGERPILTDGTSAIVAIDATVFGVSLASGAITWQTTLTDVVQFSNCDGCFAIFGTNLVAITTDGNVQAIDTRTGAAAWSRRLDGTTARGFATGGHFVVFDGTGGDYRLITLDPATGAEVVSFVPTCQDEDTGTAFATELGSTSALLASTTPDRLWFMEGSSPTCIQQYDVTTGALVSQALADSSTGSLTSSPRLLETPLGLVITSYGTLGLVDPTGTTYREVAADADTDLVAFASTDAAILVTATNRRGTTTSSIRAIDPATGAAFWDVPMKTAVAADTEDSGPGRFSATSPGQGGAYTVHLDGPAVRVVTLREFDDDSLQLTLDSLDAVTGTARPAVTIAPDTSDIIPDFGPGVWSGSRLLTSVGDDQMDVIDLTSTSITYTLA